jgi:hypothetical protein
MARENRYNRPAAAARRAHAVEAAPAVITDDGTTTDLDVILMSLMHRHTYRNDIGGGACGCGYLCSAGLNHLRHTAHELVAAGVTLTAIPEAV